MFVARVVLAGLVVVMALVTWTATASAAMHTIAGRVEAAAEITPYLLVKAVESKSGMTARSLRLDGTHTFSFAALPASVDTVEVVPQLPGHLFELQPENSVLKTAIPASGDAAVQLKVVVTHVNAAPVRANDESKGSVGSAVVAIVMLAGMWIGRHRIVSLLDMPGLRLPKQKKVMIPR